MLWWQTGMKTWQTILAAPQVIAHRTGRMATAGLLPSLRDQREFTTMGTEKVLAFSQAWMGSTRELLAFQQQMATVAARQGWAMMNAFNPLLAARSGSTPWNLMWMPASTAYGAAMRAAVSAGSHAMSALPRIAHSAVSPVHAKATGNARRLRGRS
jgi:hypothetical protein